MAHQFDRMRVADILRLKLGSVRTAPLLPGSPGSLAWAEFERMTWEQVADGARLDLPGFKTVRKLLTDQRFDR